MYVCQVFNVNKRSQQVSLCRVEVVELLPVLRYVNCFVVNCLKGV